MKLLHDWRVLLILMPISMGILCMFAERGMKILCGKADKNEKWLLNPYRAWGTGFGAFFTLYGLLHRSLQGPDIYLEEEKILNESIWWWHISAWVMAVAILACVLKEISPILWKKVLDRKLERLIKKGERKDTPTDPESDGTGGDPQEDVVYEDFKGESIEKSIDTPAEIVPVKKARAPYDYAPELLCGFLFYFYATHIQRDPIAVLEFNTDRILSTGLGNFYRLLLSLSDGMDVKKFLAYIMPLAAVFLSVYVYHFFAKVAGLKQRERRYFVMAVYLFILVTGIEDQWKIFNLAGYPWEDRVLFASVAAPFMCAVLMEAVALVWRVIRKEISGKSIVYSAVRLVLHVLTVIAVFKVFGPLDHVMIETVSEGDIAGADYIGTAFVGSRLSLSQWIPVLCEILKYYGVGRLDIVLLLVCLILLLVKKEERTSPLLLTEGILLLILFSPMVMFPLLTTYGSDTYAGLLGILSLPQAVMYTAVRMTEAEDRPWKKALWILGFVMVIYGLVSFNTGMSGEVRGLR